VTIARTSMHVPNGQSPIMDQDATSDFDQIARGLIHENSNTLGRIDHGRVAREINSVPLESERHALLMAVEAHLKPAARKRLAEALTADVRRDAARVPQPPAYGKPVVTPAPPRSILPISSTAPVSAPSTEPDADVENARLAIGKELDKIKQVYEKAPPISSPDAGKTLWNTREQIALGMKHIHDVVGNLTPRHVDTFVSQTTPDQLRDLALYDSRLQGYLHLEQAVEQATPPERLDAFRKVFPRYAHTPTHPGPVFRELLAGQVQDPANFAKLMNAYQLASQTRDDGGTFSSRSLSLSNGFGASAANRGVVELENASRTPDYHDDIVAMGRNYIQRNPSNMEKLVEALAPAVDPHVQYPLTVVQNQPVYRFGDARGVVVAETIAAIKSTNNREELKSAFDALVQTPPDDNPVKREPPLSAVFQSALQPLRLVDVGTADFNVYSWSLSQTVQSAFLRYVWPDLANAVDPERAEKFAGALPEPLLGLIDASRDPGLALSEAPPAARGALGAKVFAAAVNAVADSVEAVPSEAGRISLLDLGAFDYVQQVTRSLTDLLAHDTSQVTAALATLDQPDPGAALTKFLVFLHGENLFSSLTRPSSDSVRPDGRSRSAPLLLDVGEPLEQVWHQLLRGDNGTTDPNEYFLKGVLARGDVLIPALGRQNLGYFAGAYAGAYRWIGTLFEEDVNVTRYQQRSWVSVAREIPSMLVPGGRTVSRIIVNSVKAAAGSALERQSGAGVDRVIAMYRRTQDQFSAIRRAALPQHENLAKSPTLRFLEPGRAPLSTEFYKKAVQDFETWFDYGARFGNWHRS
jgi:hypothetical protein